MKVLLSLIKREFSFIKNQSALVAILFIAPIAYGLFYGSVYFHKAEKEVGIVIVDQDNTNLSRNLARQIDAHPLVAVRQVFRDVEDARSELSSFNAYGVLVIPREFQNSLQHGAQAHVALNLNAGRFLIANDVNRAVNEVVGTMNAGIRLRSFQAQGKPYEQALALAAPITADVRPMFNVADNYGNFFLPGLFMMIWQQTLLIAFVVSMANEREAARWPKLYQQSKNNIASMLFGKSALYIALFMLYSVVYFALLFQIFSLPFDCNIPALVILMLLHLAAIIAFAIFVGTFFKHKTTALQLMAISTYPIFLISGFSWPKFAMPASIQFVANCLPTTPFLAAMVRTTQMNAGVQHIWPELLHLLVLLSIFTVLSVLRIKALVTQNQK
jgi:ABC-2 type transport system permease protein